MEVLKELLSNNNVSFSETAVNGESNIDTTIFVSCYIHIGYNIILIPLNHHRIVNREYLLLPWIPSMQEDSSAQYVVHSKCSVDVERNYFST